MKTRQDNNMTYHTGMVYIENDTELLWLIRPGVGCDEDQTRQQREWSCRCSLHENNIELS